MNQKLNHFILNTVLRIGFFFKHHWINPRLSLVSKYWESAIESSLFYAKANFKYALVFNLRIDLWNYTIKLLVLPGAENFLNLEFGTFKGYSINYFSKRLPKLNFVGFDSFIGLQEDWKGYTFGEGAYSAKGKIPKVNKNVKLVQGWFNETLSGFLKENTQKLNFLHIDCDTYEATKLVLYQLVDRFQNGTLILFDEYIGYPGWDISEYLAFKEIVEQHKIKYEYIAFTERTVLVRVLM